MSIPMVPLGRSVHPESLLDEMIARLCDAMADMTDDELRGLRDRVGESCERHDIDPRGAPGLVAIDDEIERRRAG